VWHPKSKQYFFATQFPAAATNLACGQFCKETIELAAPATCRILD